MLNLILLLGLLLFFSLSIALVFGIDRLKD
jgi:hypothetical protein